MHFENRQASLVKLKKATKWAAGDSFDAEFGRQEMDGCLPMLDSLLLVVAMPR